MNIFGRKQAEQEPAPKPDLAFIRETYRFSDETELEPGQEPAIYQGLGITALRQATFNADHVRLAELIEKTDVQGRTKAA